MIRFMLRELISEKSFTEDRRITLEEIAKATGIHRTTLTKVANQKGYNASTDVEDKLCIYFDVPVEKLMVHIKED